MMPNTCSVMASALCKLLPPLATTRFGHFRVSTARCSSSRSTIQPPNVIQLAEKARITLTPKEVEEFGPKLEQIVDWFGQLQEVDLENISPAIRADVGNHNTLRSDVPSIFEAREDMLAAVPEAEGPYVKVPKILNENME